MSAYQPYEKLSAEALPRSGLLRLFTGTVILLVGVIALQFALIRTLERLGYFEVLSESITGSSAAGTLVSLGTFAMPLAVLWVVLRLVHERSYRGIFGARAEMLKDFFRVFLGLVGLFAVLLFLPTPQELRPVSQLPFSQWLILLPAGLLGVLLQVTAEEVIFRGYFQSQLAARFANPVIWLTVPSLLFGLVHYAPSIYGANALLIVLWATGFGLAAADITARAGNLGPAIALHFANNVMAILIIGTKGFLSGLALMVLPYGPDNVDLVRQAFIVQGPILLCMWLTARVMLRR